MPQKDIQKDVSYLGKDFQTLRNGLIDFTKQYFPNTYVDFNETSPGMMFLELSAYVGDMLSFYIDRTFKENLLLYAEEERNLYGIAQAMGYKPKLTFPAHVKVDVYQTVPAIQAGINILPNWDYALTIEENMEISSDANPDVVFRTVAPVNFANSSSADPTEVAVYEVNDDNAPTYFILKKSVDAVAGEIQESDFTFGSPEKFSKINISDENFIEIIDVYDSDGNRWYEVPYLAQDTVYQPVLNVAANDPDLAGYSDDAPYLLKLVKTARRFSTRIKPDGTIELHFGSGISANPDELIIPNPTNIGSAVFGSITFNDNPIDPVNFLYTRTYGQAPANTTLTVRFTTGGGIASNVNGGELRTINSISYDFDDTGLDSTAVQAAKDSVAVDNVEAANGGRDGEISEEIRQNALASYASQLRAVNKEDYIVRVYSMPARFGNIAKAYIVQDDQLNDENVRIPNPLALNLYVLGYDNNKNLVVLNKAVKENLRIYLGQYRMLTDAINIKDGFPINIGVKFQIYVYRNYNKREVVLRCIDRLKSFFEIDKWQFNQPLYIADVQREIQSVEGVQAVADVEITNKYKEEDGYSGNIYSIDAATRDGVVYPSLDPSIFEVRFPNRDIEGKAL